MANLTIGNLKLEVKLSGHVTWTDSQGETQMKPVSHEYTKEWSGGTSGDSQMDVFWQDSSRSLAGADFDADLVGGLTGMDGATITSFAEAGLLWAQNLSTTDDQKLTVGNGGVNAVNGTKAGFGSDTDTIATGPNGLILIVAPDDGQGIQLTAATGDILRFSPGASTFNAKIVMAGRSA